MTNPTIETDLAEILKDLQSGQKEILKEVSDLKVSLEKVKGNIQTLDEKLSGKINALDTKFDQLDKRLANQEFINRGVLIGLILALLGSAVKLFGWMSNS
jgi:flagellar capping protein FliD